MLDASLVDFTGILTGLAIGGATGTALAGAWRTRALSLWREQAEALQAQNDSLRTKIEDLEKVVAGMEGELKHLRAQPDMSRVISLLEKTDHAIELRQAEILLRLEHIAGGQTGSS